MQVGLSYRVGLEGGWRAQTYSSTKTVAQGFLNISLLSGRSVIPSGVGGGGTKTVARGFLNISFLSANAGRSVIPLVGGGGEEHRLTPVQRQ